MCPTARPLPSRSLPAHPLSARPLSGLDRTACCSAVAVLAPCPVGFRVSLAAAPAGLAGGRGRARPAGGDAPWPAVAESIHCEASESRLCIRVRRFATRESDVRCQLSPVQGFPDQTRPDQTRPESPDQIRPRLEAIPVIPRLWLLETMAMSMQLKPPPSPFDLMAMSRQRQQQRLGRPRLRRQGRPGPDPRADCLSSQGAQRGGGGGGGGGDWRALQAAAELDGLDSAGPRGTAATGRWAWTAQASWGRASACCGSKSGLNGGPGGREGRC